MTHAVKMLNQPQSAGLPWPSADDRRRWLDLRHVIQGMENPHLVHLHDVFFGPPPHAENTQGWEGDGRKYTTPYFVMEWIAGPSLDEHIINGAPALPPRLGYIRDLAEAIDSLHSITSTSGNPILHRDIKPGNCLLHPQRGLVLVDLGTLRRVDDGYDPLGPHTLNYTAPEVLRDPRNPRSFASDRYALGAVAYFCLVEDDPPAASDLLARRAMLAELTAAGRRLRAPAPEALADHIMEMLHPSPRRRPHTCVRWAEQAVILATSGAADWKVRRRRRRSIRAVIGGLVAIGTAAVAAGLSLRRPPSVDALTLLEIIGLLIVLSACALVILQFTRRRAEPRQGVAEIADLLAAAVLRQWATEARIRRLNDPYPLPVSWDAAPHQDALWERLRAAVSSWPAPFRPESAQRASRARDLAGRGEDLAQRLLDLVPSRRILLLGDAGAGKSILMVRLTLSLLNSRRPGGPVPVLIPLSSWNPEEQELRSWLRDRLSIDYPTLVEAGSGGVHANSGFDALLDTHKMILLLDGLDEIQPAALRSAAVQRINRELEPGHVFLVTCRTEDCPSAPPGESLILYTPSVVLNDLDAATVRGYLCADAGGAAAEERWERVFQARPDTAIAAVLRTPLMVSLMRAIYSPRADRQAAVLPDPEELCDTSKFPDQTAIEDHLLDGLIPAMYGNERRTRERAERWLRFLARHLDRAGASDLEWWELRRAVPRYLTGATCGLVTGSVAGAAAVLGGNHIGTGIGAGLSVGLLTVLILRRFTELTGNLANAFAAGAAGGLLGALFAGLVLNVVFRLNVPPTIGLIGGIKAGLALAPIGRTRGGAIGGFLGGVAAAVCAGRGFRLARGHSRRVRRCRHGRLYRRDQRAPDPGQGGPRDAVVTSRPARRRRGGDGYRPYARRRPEGRLPAVAHHGPGYWTGHRDRGRVGKQPERSDPDTRPVDQFRSRPHHLLDHRAVGRAGTRPDGWAGNQSHSRTRSSLRIRDGCGIHAGGDRALHTGAALAGLHTAAAMAILQFPRRRPSTSVSASSGRFGLSIPPYEPSASLGPHRCRGSCSGPAGLYRNCVAPGIPVKATD